MLAAVTWIIIASASALAAVLFYKATFQRKRRPGEPPVVSGHFLWGSAKDFAGHAVNFLHSSRRQYGEVFTLRLLNQYITFIMDPHSCEAFSKESKFDFDPIQRQVNWNVFAFKLAEPKKMLRDSTKTTRGAPLQRSMLSFDKHLTESCDAILPALQAAGGRLDDGLCHFTARTMFEAQFSTIFGKAPAGHPFNAEAVHKQFDVFHQYFNYLWLGMPLDLFPAAKKALGHMLCQPLADDMMARDDVSDYIKNVTRDMREIGQSELDVMKHNLVYLHVNYNTFRLAFWALEFLLENPKAMEALISELSQAVEDKRDDTTDIAQFSMNDIDQLKVLDSVVQETCRMSSGVFVVRQVAEDTMFKTAAGKEFLMRAGDRVAIYPPATHKDEEIFADPLVFKYDRFVDATFYKDGQELKNPVMAFGTLCPGRRYAILQMKWYLLNICLRYRFSFASSVRAQFDYRYHGHEVLPPVTDVPVHVEQRKNFTTSLQLV